MYCGEGSGKRMVFYAFISREIFAERSASSRHLLRDSAIAVVSAKWPRFEREKGGNENIKRFKQLCFFISSRTKQKQLKTRKIKNTAYFNTEDKNRQSHMIVILCEWSIALCHLYSTSQTNRFCFLLFIMRTYICSSINASKQEFSFVLSDKRSYKTSIADYWMLIKGVL